jgi:DNA replication and repair protein RecF
MVEKLWISTFRNIDQGLWSFEGVKRIGLVGNNGNGKSNFLEAIYTLLNGKSFRGCPVSDMLPFGGSKFALGMDSCGTRVYTEFHKEKGRSVQVSGTCTDMASLKKNLQISYFSSDIVRLLAESPDARRRELDRFCKRYFKDAIAIYSRFDALLKQKNKALKIQDSKMAHLFHDQLSVASANVVALRQQGLAIITDKMSAYSSFFPAVKNLSEVGFSYVSSTEAMSKAGTDSGDLGYSNLMKSLYDCHSSAELAAGFSLYGPHRDDFSLLLSGKSMARFYSRGINKISNILFRFATYDLMKAELGLPILLFDDVFAEVDSANQKGILHILEDFPQLFFTALTYDASFTTPETVWYQITDGSITKR